LAEEVIPSDAVSPRIFSFSRAVRVSEVLRSSACSPGANAALTLAPSAT
jgi:hypothetical protein